MTRKEHLKKLPLQKRLQAMENIRKQTSGFTLSERLDHSTGVMILSGSFVFMNTRQGHDYWMGIDYKYFGK